MNDLIIEGYASRFYEADLNDDLVAFGAFAQSLMRTGPQGVRMLYQHQTKTPIGVWDEVFEDARGLFVRGRVLEVSPEAGMVASLIRAGAIDGLSIGFRTQKSRPDLSGRLRVLLEVELWEISIVTFPMLTSARLKVSGPEAVAA
jgi:uncharacterized protein